MSTPRAAWTGTWYLVAWTDEQNVVNTIRVGRDGQVIDAKALRRRRPRAAGDVGERSAQKSH